MTRLAQWLEDNFDALVQAAVTELSQDEQLRSQVLVSVEAFFQSFIQAAETNDPTPLDYVFSDWVEARSSPTEDEPTGGVVPAVAILKRVTWDHILQSTPPEEALGLLSESDRIYTQSLLRLSRLEASALLVDMRRELVEAKAYVEYLDKRKADFVAVSAHELKTPLTIIEGYSDILRQNISLHNDNQAAGLLDGMSTGIRRLRDIIQDMIDVSLINLDMLKLHFQQIRLHQIIDAVERQIEDVLQDRRVNILIEKHTIPHRTTYADPIRLLQVVQKVILNGVKYTPDGGEVRITARELPGFTDLIVMDTGIGISPTKIQHIFDMFSSQVDVALHSSGKTKFKGAGPGLGLAICKGIIDAHGGNIWAESAGHDEETCPGSTFHILIPMYTSEPQLASNT